MPSFRRFPRVKLAASMGWVQTGGQEQGARVNDHKQADPMLGYFAGPHAPDKGTSDRA
jgi:hypothetical protein